MRDFWVALKSLRLLQLISFLEFILTVLKRVTIGLNKIFGDLLNLQRIVREDLLLDVVVKVGLLPGLTVVLGLLGPQLVARSQVVVGCVIVENVLVTPAGLRETCLDEGEQFALDLAAAVLHQLFGFIVSDHDENV